MLVTENKIKILRANFVERMLPSILIRLRACAYDGRDWDFTEYAKIIPHGFLKRAKK